ncbi:MAG: VanZ family protein [Pseudomonadota bacterium]
MFSKFIRRHSEEALVPFIFVNRPTHWVVGYLLLIAIFAGSVVSADLHDSPSFPGADKIIHALAYACLGFWFAQLMAPIKHWSVIGVIFCYGGLIELIQHQLSYRSGSLADLAANATGLLIAHWFYRIMQKSL